MGRQQIARSEQLRSDQLLALPMTRHRNSLAHLAARQLASARLDNMPVMAIDSLTAQKRLIEAGIGIALLPESIIQEELRLGTLRTIDIPHLQTTVPIHVLYRKNCYLTGASRTLLSAGVSNVKVLRAIGPMPPMRCPMSRRRRSPLD